jgi:glycosyltransferase involved in cell wall biosynthesis
MYSRMTRHKFKKKIYFDNIVFSMQRAGGVSVYWHELLKRIIRDGIDFNVIESEKAADNIFRSKIFIHKQNIKKEININAKYGKHLPVYFSVKKGSIYHSSYYRIHWTNNSKTIQTVYDFVYEHYVGGINRFIHSAQKRLALKKAAGIICISENTKRDLLHFMPELKGKKIKVINLAYSDEYHTIDRCEIITLDRLSLKKGSYVIFVGGRERYKNFKIAVEAVKKVNGCILVIVGGGALKEDEKVLLETMLLGRYQFHDNLPSVELNKLYNHALALIYPSSYEGFGIPVLEAMAASCPVIAINKSSMPEVCGDAGVLVDELSSDEIAYHIEKFKESIYRETVIEKGLKNVKRFSWEKCYLETISFYHEIIAESKQ